MTDLEQAVITIKEECKKHKKCAQCPLRNVSNYYGPMCGIKQVNPEKWSLKSECEDDCQPSIFK